MDRQQFYFLFVNLNSLCELGLRQLTEEILSESAQADQETAALTDEEIEARVNASFENMDMSALDGFDINFSEVLSGAPAVSGNSVPEPPLAFLEEMPPALPESEEPFDINVYMERAYSHEAKLGERVDDGLRRADFDAINSALAGLPKDLPALTGRLSAEDMSAWLALYQAGHGPLSEAVVQIRRLDFPDDNPK